MKGFIDSILLRIHRGCAGTLLLSGESGPSRKGPSSIKSQILAHRNAKDKATQWFAVLSLICLVCALGVLAHDAPLEVVNPKQPDRPIDTFISQSSCEAYRVNFTPSPEENLVHVEEKIDFFFNGIDGFRRTLPKIVLSEGKNIDFDYELLSIIRYYKDPATGSWDKGVDVTPFAQLNHQGSLYGLDVHTQPSNEVAKIEESGEAIMKRKKLIPGTYQYQLLYAVKNAFVEVGAEKHFVFLANTSLPFETKTFRASFTEPVVYEVPYVFQQAKLYSDRSEIHPSGQMSRLVYGKEFVLSGDSGTDDRGLKVYKFEPQSLEEGETTKLKISVINLDASNKSGEVL